MRYLILSDIHSNLEALEAVLAEAPPDQFDRLLVLGDVVGYGADPNAVVERVRQLQPHVMIRGNHDKVSSGVESAEDFNTSARFAAHWTQTTLTPENREYLGALPLGPVIVDSLIELCHGSPTDEDEYIFEPVDAIEAIREARCPICFYGHTHVAVAYWLSSEQFDMIVPLPQERVTEIVLDPRRRYLVNPGSVGQPRDGDPRAAYATFDSEARLIRLHRVEYDIAKAQQKIREADLPEGLARRLAAGK
jgi:diadenosine tetraphosphatase ApaH/serine/threonine PP2A family protein phosphatase